MFENIKLKSWDIIRESYYLFDDLFNLRSNIRLAKNIALKNRHKGERAFLLLTGESIQHINIKKLENEITYGSNLIILHQDIKDIDLTYFSNLDDNRILKSGLPQWPADQLGDLGDNGALKFYREINNRLPISTTLILNSINYKYYKNEPSFNDRNIIFCKKGKNLKLDSTKPIDLVADMTKRLQGGGSVYYSLLTLMYMGFKEIYLCGAGYTYEPMYYWHFYDIEHNIFPMSMNEEEVCSTIKDNLNIINNECDAKLEFLGLLNKDGYYRGITGYKQKYNDALRGHNVINDFAASKGVRIINITPDGFESPVYEKISWNEVEIMVRNNVG
jgi:hypothetical protein